MKYILVLLCMVSSVAMATGKLSMKPVYDQEQKKMFPVVGLSVYEKITDSIAFNHWTGFGEVIHSSPKLSPDQGDLLWTTSKTQIDFNSSRVTVSPGFQFTKTSDEAKWHKGIYIEIATKLW